MKSRCYWATSQILQDYHDNEWGRIIKGDNEIFELFILETMSVGLSWEMILKKREAYRNTFCKFDLFKIAAFSDEQISEILNSKELDIVKSESKIKSIFTNANKMVSIVKEYGSLYNYFWSFVDYKVIVRDYSSKEMWINKHENSNSISDDLKKRGLKFVGPVILYSFVQALGMIEDHQNDCFLKTKYKNHSS